MKYTFDDLANPGFRSRIWGYDSQQVTAFLNEVAEEMVRLRRRNQELERDCEELLREIDQHKEREQTLRNVLVTAQKTSDQIKANAEKEAGLIVAEAEQKAEKILRTAHQRLHRIQEDILELRRQRTQFETKLRSTIETYRQLLEIDREEEAGGEEDLDNKLKLLG